MLNEALEPMVARGGRGLRLVIARRGDAAPSTTGFALIAGARRTGLGRSRLGELASEQRVSVGRPRTPAL
jgi:hypothetical protein